MIGRHLKNYKFAVDVSLQVDIGVGLHRDYRAPDGPDGKKPAYYAISVTHFIFTANAKKGSEPSTRSSAS